MTLEELFPTLRVLSRSEKLQAIQFLASELVKEDDNLLKPGAEYPVWSPYDAFDAAAKLQDILKAHEETERNG